jgi:ZU5 domain
MVSDKADMHTARIAFTATLLASVAGCDALDADRIGAEGGVVVSADGRMALEIPAGALDEAVEITIRVTQGPEGALAPVYVIEPMGLTFQYPTELVFDYDAEMLGAQDPEALVMVTHRELGWDYLPDRVVDEDDQTISVSLMALSPVTVVAQ